MKKTSIIITFILALATLPIYIYSYKSGAWMIFWSVFILDRIISPIIEPRLEKSLEDTELEADDGTITIGRFLILMLLFCIISLGIMGYILFKYPKLFIILILGEVLDQVLRKIIEEFKKK
ncbi:hypothetical protein [Clostridium sp. B9]|uniref:hypothetical protein n=1 Tax=Clostridium sp. B9 TaxID=3423224 RepID=UPI003D2F3A03